ncbi:shikimate dehydrogenase [Natronincola ferrireducens]|uniref:Shikimate dehydrogenase (NADP(+)) n=1 Tax=Natronincola ferrireducens TaxID=393762 RepID=A0A1G9CME2_9FIRM|nr:shikimate dehydrogenase [Natronincola ferrireducens]SDK52654.1 shikimate dehydrogenase [Natronincola ferrireducens]
MNTINGKTKTICLLGNPVDHSFSPIIHNYGFQQLNMNCVYVNHKVEEKKLREAIEGIKALGYIGCNVTYPHKIKIMEFLDDITEEAQLIGAVNTVKNENGKLIGYNTDGLGFVNGLKRKGIDLHDKRIVLLGAGGAAKSIAVALAIHFDCSIKICNRSINKAIEVINVLNTIKKSATINHEAITPEELHTEEIDILINCTPIGMVPNVDHIPFEDQLKLHSHLIVSDIIYQPFETKLLKKAKENNCKIHHGLDMLIDQGILAFEIWTDAKLDFQDLKGFLKSKIYHD